MELKTEHEKAVDNLEDADFFLLKGLLQISPKPGTNIHLETLSRETGLSISDLHISIKRISSTRYLSISTKNQEGEISSVSINADWFDEIRKKVLEYELKVSKFKEDPILRIMDFAFKHPEEYTETEIRSKFSNKDYISFSQYCLGDSEPLAHFPDSKLKLTQKGVRKYYELIGTVEHIKIEPHKQTSKKILSISLNEYFYDSLIDEINNSYTHGLFTGVIVLSRKLIENLIIDILRKRFPPKIKGNLELYYGNYRGGGRFHDFNVLIENLKNKKDDFKLDKTILLECLSLINPFISRANSAAHSITIISDEEELNKFKIEKMVALLKKLLDNS